MTFTVAEILPLEEARQRHAACRRLLARLCPQAGGLLAFSRTAVYHLSGTMANGLLWLPLEGEPVLMARKGVERCRLESPLPHICALKSYGDVPAVCADAGSPLSETAAAEMEGLPWSLAELLQSRLPGCAFVSGDAVLARARSVKTPWELEKMRLAGQKHAQALHETLPQRLRPGLTERQISRTLWEVFFSLGHMGWLRMGRFGEEAFLGRVAAGENANCPSPFNGPTGLRGEHPATPFMGYAGSVWRRGMPLMVDCGFMHEGYHTDMSVTYWAGPPASIPDLVRRAHACCVEILQRAACGLRPGAVPSRLWEEARLRGRELGFEEGFMGLGDGKAHFLGHGIGLTMDGWPVLAAGMDEPLEENMTIALEPKIGLPGLGMVGVEEVFVVTPAGGRCITGGRTEMHCVES